MRGAERWRQPVENVVHVDGRRHEPLDDRLVPVVLPFELLDELLHLGVGIIDLLVDDLLRDVLRVGRSDRELARELVLGFLLGRDLESLEGLKEVPPEIHREIFGVLLKVEPRVLEILNMLDVLKPDPCRLVEIGLLHVQKDPADRIHRWVPRGYP